MKLRSVVVVLSLSVACRTAPSWDPRAPLAPAIRFNEIVPPRGVSVLVVDAHSGKPVDYAIVQLQPARVQLQTDSSGVARAGHLPVGTQQLRVRRIGYEVWHDSLIVSDSGGAAIIAQLRRSRLPPVPVVPTS